MLISDLKQEGISEQEAIERITLMDVNGLLETSRTDLSAQQKRYAKAMPHSRDLLATIKAIKPTAPIAVSSL